MPIESSVNGLPVGPITARALLHATAGQRNIGGDDDVVFSGALGDPVVGNIGAFGHDHPLDHVAARHGHEGIGHHKDLEAVALRHPVNLGLYRTGIGIDENANCGLFRLFHDLPRRDPIHKNSA